MWGLSSLTRGWTCTPCIVRWHLNHQISREAPIWVAFLSHLLFHLCSVLLQPTYLGQQSSKAIWQPESDWSQLQEKSRTGLGATLDLPATRVELSSWRSFLGTEREQVSHYANPAWGAKLGVPEAPLPSTFTSPYQTLVYQLPALMKSPAGWDPPWDAGIILHHWRSLFWSPPPPHPHPVK